MKALQKEIIRTRIFLSIIILDLTLGPASRRISAILSSTMMLRAALTYI
jgi:hypothetical protein